MRRAARIDANQNEIVNAARGVGCSVWITSAMGAGAPDLVIGCPRTFQNFMVEVKDGSLSPSRRALTPDEAKFHRDWRGQICIIESVEQLYRLLGVKP